MFVSQSRSSTTTTTRTRTRTKTKTKTPTRTRTKTKTKTNTPTRTRTKTKTKTCTPTRTRTKTKTKTNTPTKTRTRTRTGTPESTPTPTRTRTKTKTKTKTSSPVSLGCFCLNPDTELNGVFYDARDNCVPPQTCLIGYKACFGCRTLGSETTERSLTVCLEPAIGGCGTHISAVIYWCYSAYDGCRFRYCFCDPTTCNTYYDLDRDWETNC